MEGIEVKDKCRVYGIPELIDLKRSMKPLKEGKGRRGAELRTKMPLFLFLSKAARVLPFSLSTSLSIMSYSHHGLFLPQTHVPVFIFIMG